MSPPAPQVPDLPPPAATSQIGTAAPPDRSTRFSFPGVKNPSDRPSGDQKSDEAFSVPGIGRASSAESSRTQIPGPSWRSGAAMPRARRGGCVRGSRRRRSGTRRARPRTSWFRTSRRRTCLPAARARIGWDALAADAMMRRAPGPGPQWRARPRRFPRAAIRPRAGAAPSPRPKTPDRCGRTGPQAAGRRRAPSATARRDPSPGTPGPAGRGPVGSSGGAPRREAARP